MRNRLNRLPLFSAGSLFDDRHERAIAKMDRAGPRTQDTPAQTIQPHVPEVALVNLYESEGSAIALGRHAVELARATPTAVTVRELHAFHAPFYVFTHNSS